MQTSHNSRPQWHLDGLYPIPSAGCLKLLYIWSQLKQISAKSQSATVLSSQLLWSQHSSHFFSPHLLIQQKGVQTLLVWLSFYALSCFLCRCPPPFLWTSWRRAGNCTWWSATITIAKNLRVPVSQTHRDSFLMFKPALISQLCLGAQHRHHKHDILSPFIAGMENYISTQLPPLNSNFACWLFNALLLAIWGFVQNFLARNINIRVEAKSSNKVVDDICLKRRALWKDVSHKDISQCCNRRF